MRECNRPVLFAVDGNVTHTATLRADDCVSDDRLSFLELLQLTAMHSQTSYLQLAGHLRMNEVNTSGPVSTWMADSLRAGIPSRYVTSQLGQLKLASIRGRSIDYQLWLG